MLNFFLQKKKFGSNYIAIVLTKQNSDQPMLQFSTQNKIRINLCCNCQDKQNSDQPMLNFFLQKKNNKNQAILQLFWQNKIRINLCCNFSHKTKFGSTYVAIFHTKQNSDQPMLQFFTQNKIRETCPRMWGAVSAETRKYISNHFRQPRQNSLL